MNANASVNVNTGALNSVGIGTGMHGHNVGSKTLGGHDKNILQSKKASINNITNQAIIYNQNSFSLDRGRKFLSPFDQRSVLSTNDQVYQSPQFRLDAQSMDAMNFSTSGTSHHQILEVPTLVQGSGLMQNATLMVGKGATSQQLQQKNKTGHPQINSDDYQF